MAASIWYKDRRLYKGSAGILSGLGNKIMSITPRSEYVSDNILAFITCLGHPTAHSLDDFSLDDLKILTQLLIKAINELEREGYFVIDDEEREYLIKHNMPTDIRNDKRQALELIKGLEEIIRELEAE